MIASLGFTAPIVLTALALLPVIWWLLRVTPPRPQRIAFPPTRLLMELAKREETPSRSPWWLMLLRLLLAALIIIALAGPIWRPAADGSMQSGPLWLVVDNGWSAADDWPARSRVATTLLDEAQSAGRPVVLVGTADGSGQPVEPAAAGDVRDRLAALEPRSWPVDRAALVPLVERMGAASTPGSVAWLAGDVGGEGADAFETALASAAGDAPIRVYRSGAPGLVALAGVDNASDGMDVRLLRLDGAAPETVEGTVVARDRRGFSLAEAPFAFADGATETTVRFDLPVQLRNDIARVDVPGSETAGSVQLIDDRWQRRAVGLVSGGSADLAQPLLSPLHYLERAVGPFAEVREPRSSDLASAVDQLVDGGVSVIMLADVGTLVGSTEETLSGFVQDGGVLIRFAGPRTVEGVDALVPVPMREGARVLGGSLSWEDPQPLAPFDETGPFAGLETPDDVSVTRQLLAEPSAVLPDRTWASLADGTPLVTARGFGNGWLVFFHVTADTTWSTLPLSGTFVDMLRKLIGLAGTPPGGEGQVSSAPLPPLRVLDGAGQLVQPGPSVRPLPAGAVAEVALGPEHPPGLYGTEDGFRAINLLGPDDGLAPLDLGPLADRAVITDYASEGPVDLRGWVLGAASVLLLLDALAVLVLSGGLGLGRREATAAVMLAALALVVTPTPGFAQDDGFDMEAALATRFGYVLTGDDAVDETSRAGLSGLSMFLARRTALEPAEPMGVDLEEDDLAFFPLLYWPVTEDAARPTDEAMAKVDAYMKNGGTILFDTKDQISAGTRVDRLGASPATLRLRAILDGLNIPPLEPVPPDHVLTKAFYLLQEFPGRWAGGPLWVEALSADVTASDRPARSADGVSPIMITANDFAGAWAIGTDGQFMFPTVPADPFQREMAIRTGINIVMYTLTGNYKADQVHIPALLERLGQ
ncbi:DUF4159 domain-containing protein [Amorphus orientalis]|uniref:LytTR family transcriptional regulator n=1 Tax=Amorphus orientalis TaxID=649198 RepID=A0AAE4ARI9_9HYPH|nr:DUF4159 domain-containing protein [Amorphus orientalis]MDQ0313890.1 hypothetical protein [Amorphus orientalis]